jgi:iron complex outermembrane receptor protein
MRPDTKGRLTMTAGYSRGIAAFALSVALAQGAAAQTTAEAEAAPDEIVVTAQLRSQTLQSVPLAISAVSGDKLLAEGINNPVDLRFVAPSLNFANSANTRGEGLSIRGVGTSIFGDGVEQSVGVVVDGVAMSRNGMGTMSMIDVDRVEVLRGPQGMLFGKNASAGVISIVTKKPVVGETSLAVGASYATLDDIRFNGTVNIPIGDSGAFRLAYSRTDRDGIVENIQRREMLNDRNEDIVRGKLLAEPTDKLSILVIGDWSKSEALCCAWTARSAAPGQAFAALNAAAGIVPGPRNTRNAAGARFFQNQEQFGFSMQVDYDLGFAGLTSISAYRNWKAVDNNDPDILPVNILDVNTGDSEVDQYSQELRLTSASGSALEWTAGLFYFHVDNRGGNTQAGTLGVALPPGATLGSTRRSETYNRSVAAYGQVGFALTEQLKVSAAGRYTDEELRFDWRQFNATGTIGGFPGRFVGGVTDATRKDDNFSWRLIGQYEATDDVMAFASVARGYKGAAYDQQLVSTTPIFVEPEIPTSYELGVRSVLFERALTLNLTAFKSDFKNFQAQAFDQNVFPSRFTTVNAGKLTTQGVEGEFTLRPSTGLTLSGNATYLDSEYEDFQNIACYIGQPLLAFGTARTDPRQCIRVSATGAGVTTGTGLPLPDAPKFTYTLSGNYDVPVGDVTASFGLNWFWRGDVTYSSNGDPGLRQDGYGLLGANVGVRDPDGKWRVSLFARNLLDKFFVARVIAQPTLNSPVGAPLGSYAQFPAADARRIIGVSVDFKFGG